MGITPEIFALAIENYTDYDSKASYQIAYEIINLLKGGNNLIDSNLSRIYKEGELKRIRTTLRELNGKGLINLHSDEGNYKFRGVRQKDGALQWSNWVTHYWHLNEREIKKASTLVTELESTLNEVENIYNDDSLWERVEARKNGSNN